MKFECSTFSAFPEEKETLFFGGDTKLKIKGIMQLSSSGSWKYYDKYMEPINALNHFVHGLSLKGEDILNFKKRQKKMLMNLIQDVLRPLLLESNKSDLLDFAAMSETVGVGELVLREGLKDYQLDRDRLISELIDVVYGEEEQKMDIWRKLKVKQDRKMEIFQDSLHYYFDCIQLNSVNFVKICDKMVRRLFLRIDVRKLAQKMSAMDLDETFKNSEQFLNYKTFRELFRSSQQCSDKDVAALYEALVEWKYVEQGQHVVDMVVLSREVIDDMKSGKASKSQFIADQANEYGSKMIDFFVEHPEIDGNTLFETKRKAFCKMMIDYCGDTKVRGVSGTLQKRMIQKYWDQAPKYDVKRSLLEIVKQVLEDFSAGKGSTVLVTSAKEFGNEVIEYFEKNPDIDSDALAAMTRKDFARELIDHCNTKKVRGLAGNLQKNVIEMINDTNRDLISVLEGRKENKKVNVKQAVIPQYISDLVKSQISSTAHVRLSYGELMSEYDFLHCIFKSKTANTVDIANIAVLFHEAESITIVLKEGDRIRSDQWRSLTMGLSKMYEMGLSMMIQFDLSQCPSDERETMYNKAVTLLTECGDKFKCEPGNHGNLLKFETVENVNQTETSKSRLSECVQLMIDNISEAQLAMKVVAKPEQKEQNQVTVWDSGEQYFYWKSKNSMVEKHPNYVAAKFNDLKEEVLKSAVLSKYISAKAWNSLMAQVRCPK